MKPTSPRRLTGILAPGPMRAGCRPTVNSKGGTVDKLARSRLASISVFTANSADRNNSGNPRESNNRELNCSRVITTNG